jgi:hypothetical protein
MNISALPNARPGQYLGRLARPQSSYERTQKRQKEEESDAHGQQNNLHEAVVVAPEALHIGRAAQVREPRYDKGHRRPK